MGRNEPVDMEASRMFFDPHPGFAGAAIPIPGPVKRIADSMDGQTMSLREAMERLSAPGIGQIELVAKYGYLGLRLGGGGRHAEHFFRVIKYR